MSLALALSACNRIQATAEAKPARPKSAAKAPKKEAVEAKAKAAEPEDHDGPKKFVVPFAWEASRDEPLSQARAYLKEILGDNRVYMEHGPKFFASFAEGQKPRATVITCGDSRVHSSAFDATPENDDFMVRNIGNQIDNNLGSVEYGVEHLETPVLLVLGHTGCGAVKAAMGDISTQSEAVRHELEKLQVPKAKSGVTPEAAWTEAVIENVHAQVRSALTHFGTRVQEGKLTVVGAVYDFRNDLGKGSGKITIVDVNGNGESGRMTAFVEAIEAEGGPAGKKNAKLKKLEDKPEAQNPDIPPALRQAIDRAKELAGQTAKTARSEGHAATSETKPGH
ncbi:MAG TPA: carbonic anhydrase [Polyangiaceae bacterium]|nr:carbonic anhydrase [Polyangiaceae bacterium]